MKTVFITGASSGIGKETAMLFLANGWNVIASMRNSMAELEFNKHPNVLLLQCDVTEQQSIENAAAPIIMNPDKNQRKTARHLISGKYLGRAGITMAPVKSR